jgi:hypothetical protein
VLLLGCEVVLFKAQILLERSRRQKNDRFFIERNPSIQMTDERKRFFIFFSRRRQKISKIVGTISNQLGFDVLKFTSKLFTPPKKGGWGAFLHVMGCN